MSHAPLWRAAAAFAASAHAGQTRKDGRTPYFAHCARVALTVSAVFGVDDEAILAAALLHDTIEDCGCDVDAIAESFGPGVAGIVACLSKDMRLPEAERERAYDAQLAAGPWPARLIKLADVFDNVQESWDADSRRTALERCRRALALADGDPRLASARQAVLDMLRRLEGESAGRKVLRA
jgi:guanosine-3',5'-bis(diphosphate) 3'-pyrophosphohydrolase